MLPRIERFALIVLWSLVRVQHGPSIESTAWLSFKAVQLLRAPAGAADMHYAGALGRCRAPSCDNALRTDTGFSGIRGRWRACCFCPFRVSRCRYCGAGSVSTCDVERRCWHARFFAGLVAWQPGELRDELKRGLWHVLEPEADLVLRKSTESLWEELVAKSERYASGI